MVRYTKGLFLFHRDLRVHDNVGLREAAAICDQLYTCFIFTPDQVGTANPYRSQTSIQFMIESLDELAAEIRTLGGNLGVFYGHQTQVLDDLITKHSIDYIACNKDYTPYALERDGATRDLCTKHHIPLATFADYYLFEPGTVLTGQKEAYKKYTPFYRAVLSRHVDAPRPFRGRLATFRPKSEFAMNMADARAKFVRSNETVAMLVHGGRTLGTRRLAAAVREQAEYDKTRDYFARTTTHLSAYIKFGCVSIREVYHAFHKKYGPNHGLIRELIWREFFAHVLYAYPDVLGQSYQRNMRSIRWRTNANHLECWKEGRTGFPLVDACMRQLNATGYMHNRGRMLVASFLCKILLLDWRRGEQYFAQRLTDYDVASNNGNWQGISGTGVDRKPYFRDMNPWIQSAKFDPTTEFIKHWVPELKDVPPRDIHRWYETAATYRGKVDYPPPIVDYAEQKRRMLAMYSAAA